MENIKERIAEICRLTGPRLAGSEEEALAARLIRQKYESWGLETGLEEFPIRPRAIHALILATGGLYVLAFGLFFVLPPLSLALLLLLFGQAALQLTLAASPFNLLLARRTSQNVIAKLAPAKERKQVLIFGGHHDSAFRMPLLSRRTYRLVLVLFPLLIVAILALSVLAFWSTWAWFFATGPGPAGSLTQTVILSVCGCSMIGGLVLVVGMVRSDVVMGANDNLSAVAVSLALAESLSSRPTQHTELWFISFGSEETGLTGSRNFVRRHLQDLQGSILINLESLGQQGTLRAITGELMGATSHSKEVIALITSAARAAGAPISSHWLSAGITDAASFSAKGLQASTLIRLDQQNYLDHYHNPGDDLPAIHEEGLQQGLAVCLEAVSQVDR